MALRPEMSLLGGLAVGGVVYATYQVMLPPAADVKTVESENRDIESSERTATWASAGIVSAISLLTKDPGIFIIGGAFVILLSYVYKHADMVSPLTGKVLGDLKIPVPGGMSEAPQDTNAIYVDESV